MLFDANRLNRNVAHVYDTEDSSELKAILGRGYHAVVGNPPYIAVQDAALRDAYRTRYASCHGKYVLTVPFMERFFELARLPAEDGRMIAGFVGKITGNNFMKREFGAPLVEQFLPSVDVQTVIDASGAYIPGHGTPTIMLFGRSRRPISELLRVIDGIRGEPKQPEDPAAGLVWTSIETLVDRPGEEDGYVRATDIPRADLFKHPMTLGVGRALRQRLESFTTTLGTVADSLGPASFTGTDDGFVVDPATAKRFELGEVAKPFVVGDAVRDWCIQPRDEVIAPYGADYEPLSLDMSSRWARLLWPNRTTFLATVSFGSKTRRDLGDDWWTWYRWIPAKYRVRLSIAWGFVATHNHFVLDRGGAAFNRSAPLIKLPERSTETDHLSLLGVLNSSVAMFWLRQVSQPKGGAGIGRGIHDEAWEPRLEFDSSKLTNLPLPARRSSILPEALDRLARERAALLTDIAKFDGRATLTEHLAALRQRDRELTERLVSLQEELDWQALAAYGLVMDDLPVLGERAPLIAAGERAFEIVLARQVAAGAAETSWFERHESTPITEIPRDWPAEYHDVVARRIALIESDPNVGAVERPEHKRRWKRAPWEDRQRSALTRLVLDALEDHGLWSDRRPRSTNELTDVLRRQPLPVDALELLADRKDADLAATLQRLVLEAAVPHLVAQRLTPIGLRKREIWERVWDLQRAEDRGDNGGTIPVPPRYASSDFRSAIYWKHRGKLDLPNERFVLIPNAERGADPSPVVGWAGWNERDLARALAGRITELRQEHAADAQQLVPLLAGVLELLPWIHQWHPGSRIRCSAAPPARSSRAGSTASWHRLGVTREALRAWRPPTPTRGRKATASTA